MFTLKLSKIRSKLKSAQKFWQNHRKKIVTLSLLLVVFGVLAPNLSNIAHAAPGDDAGTDLFNALLPVMRALRKLLWPFLILIGNLLQGDLIFGGPMESTLLKVWVNVRNIVNILFALLLVGIALYNVVGGFKQDFHLKEVMPKFIIGLILVNFTFLGIKAALDGINVIATGIFALPRAIGYTLNRETIEDRFCRALYTNDNKVYAPPAGKDGLCTTAGSGEKAHLKGSVDSNGKPIDNGMDNINNYFDNINARNVAVVLAINFQNIDLINDVSSGLSGQEASIKNLVVNVILSVLLYVVYGSAFIALFIVLLVRVIVLWVLVVLSPLVAFMWVLPGELKSMMSGGEDIKQQFVKHAIVPIPVAISLAIGTILLDALKNTKFPDWSLNQTTSGVQFFTSGISSFQELIAAVACVAFIWTAVFDAMKDTKAAGITNGIKDWVGGMGKSIAKLPLMAPMFPLDAGKDKRASILDVYLAAKNVPLLMGQKEHKSASEAFPQAFSVADNALSKIATAKDFPSFMAEVKKLDPATFRSEAAQKQMAAYFAKNPLDKANAKMPDGFFKTLAEGKVQAPQMDQFGKNIDYKYEEPTSGAAATADADKLTAALNGKAKDGDIAGLVNAYKNRGQVTDKAEKAKLDALEKALKSNDDKAIDTALTGAQPVLETIAKKAKTDETRSAEVRDKVAPILNKIDGLSAKKPEEKSDALKSIEAEISKLKLDPKTEGDREQMETVQKYLRAANVTADDVKGRPSLEACLTYTPPKPPEPPKASGGAGGAATKPNDKEGKDGDKKNGYKKVNGTWVISAD